MTDPRPIAEIATELQQARARLTAALDERSAAEKRLKALNIEINGLHRTSGFSATGRIQALMSELEAAKRIERDKRLPDAVWVKAPYSRDPKRTVVHKVTAKRIYVRTEGNDRSDFYPRDTGEKWGDVLDVDATLAAWDARDGD